MDFRLWTLDTKLETLNSELETLNSELETLHYDVIIIGGGAAGLFCASEAGKRGRKVLVIEHAGRVGKKIAISGGGRCNFTNIYATAEQFLSANPHFCKSALARYTPHDFIALVNKHDIRYHEKKLGQLFCNESAQQIIDLLLNECADAGVEISCNSTVDSIAKIDDQFEVIIKPHRLTSTSLVIATGGLSIKPLGATDFGYRIAEQFGLAIEPPRPGLVPFTLDPSLLERLSKLSGISIDAVVSHNKTSFRENVLITHRGLSGPAVLQISSYWKPGDTISIDLLPDIESFEADEAELINVLARSLPKRFAQAWCELFAHSKPLKQYGRRELETIASQLHDFKILPSGTEGFKKAEVTVGGISTRELSSQTMEAKKVPGLYFIGEVVDVTGHLGGYNFQWAWSSGYVAGQSL
ncbi:MAG TPA: NAD(P)/FAD-dependent oxidoreductase [Pyrinomonadaceae bacterium]